MASNLDNVEANRNEDLKKPKNLNKMQELKVEENAEIPEEFDIAADFFTVDERTKSLDFTADLSATDVSGSSSTDTSSSSSSSAPINPYVEHTSNGATKYSSNEPASVRPAKPLNDKTKKIIKKKDELSKEDDDMTK